MNCVIVYNGVSGSGKSEVIECIRTMYKEVDSGSKQAKYMGIGDICVTGNGQCTKIRPISIGIIRDISVMEEYSKFLLRLIEGPHTWIYKADYNSVCEYLRSKEKRKLLVKLKNVVESALPGCTNHYTLELIDKYIVTEVKNKRWKDESSFDDTRSIVYDNKRISYLGPNKYDMVSCINLFFVSIREPDQIKDFVENCPYPVRTLLITRPGENIEVADGYTMDVISEFKYDYFIENPDGVDNILSAVKSVMHEILRDFAENTPLSDEDNERLNMEEVLMAHATDFNPWIDKVSDYTDKPIVEAAGPGESYSWKPFKPTDEYGNELTPV